VAGMVGMVDIAVGMVDIAVGMAFMALGMASLISGIGSMGSSGRVLACRSGRTGTRTGHPMPIHQSSLPHRLPSLSNLRPRWRSSLLRRPSGIIATIPRATTRMCASALVAGVQSPQRRPKVWSALSSATR
jgi:hypothetical protein